MFFIIGGVILFLILKILSVPFKIIFKLVVNAIAGAVLLLIVNLFLSNFGAIVPLTNLNCILVGIFGVPAAIVLVIYYAM
ncbi:inhibitor of the pro-sigma K processing machinery [Ezakiella coagulans]|uniref:Inhibitor of the pro-sigma K processing machinery n=1 Tax=Ezakiella coagulans TaxID=46507 RepID=A0A2U1E734_9FIRM|nr:pro-sigmaK processing inhibitor BofA family protein [Ezakiella coagulans]PVY95764.1 inhibitor of the pro-sigma K processing machinery [Ezakiella coagulans]